MLNINPELFKTFAFWTSIIGLKVLAMAPLTTRQRFRKQVFMNPEDTKFTHKATVGSSDDDVERVRRAHLNDLENIPVWMVVTLLWLTTNPSVWLATNLIRCFALCRIAHTLVYAVCPMQPARALSFGLGTAVTVYEAVATIITYL
ncbi:microsomal glutathione S-transferase 1 [Calliopsis andreniformis]|uniref:microsomal glutathione S-transferase 1 n=1 Tax=Calliopsis andreniformis TaxID=337506 RepID=UPI003FCD2759